MVEGYLGRSVRAGQSAVSVKRPDIWLGMEGSNLRFLIQSQASYHWTNPQHSGWTAAPMTAAPMAPALTVKSCGTTMVLTGQNGVKTHARTQLDIPRGL